MRLLTLIIDLIPFDSVSIESFRIISVHGLSDIDPGILVLYVVQFCPMVVKTLKAF